MAFLAIPISLLFFPELLYGIPRYPNENISSNTNKIVDNKVSPEPATIEIAEIEPGFVELADQIIQYIELHKPYLNPNFSVAQLAVALKVPQHHISYCFNKVFQQRFTKMKTKLRVEHAKKLLANGEHLNITIDAIGLQSGFSTRSNFFSSFKEEAGCTPTEYLQKTQLLAPIRR